MDDSTFSFPRPDDTDAAVQRAQARVLSTGGTFHGDSNAGDFVGRTLIGKVVGSYIVKAAEVSVTISQKPRFAPMSKIESKIREFFA